MYRFLPLFACSLGLVTTGQGQFICDYQVEGPSSNAAFLDGGTSVAISDESAVTVPLPFSFNFYGENHDSLTITSEGYVTFDGSVSVSNAPTTLPAASQPSNLIAGVWDDLDIDSAGSIGYDVVGSSPTAMFVVKYTQVPYVSSDSTVSFQIRLYEESNVIEIHTENVEIDSGGVRSQGIENATGTKGQAAAGRNLTDWSLNLGDSVGDVVRFIPVIDSLPPDFANCSHDTTISADSGSCGAIFVYDSITALDGCSGAATTVLVSGQPSGQFLPLGSTTSTYSTTDEFGQIASCSFTVTVEDTEAPIIICDDADYYLNNEGWVTVDRADLVVSISDNCGFMAVTGTDTFSCDNEGSANLLTLSVSDSAGNVSTCTSTITVIDTIALIAVCNDLSVELDSNGAAEIALDQLGSFNKSACSIRSSATQTAFGCGDLGMNQVELTATAPSGIAATCTSTIEVFDNNLVKAECNDFTVQLDQNGQASIQAGDIDAGSSSFCGGLTISVSPSQFDCASNLNTVITFVAASTSGASDTCFANLTFLDSIAPFLICGADTTIESTDSCGTHFAYAMPTQSDNCAGNSISLISGIESGGFFPVGTHVQIFSVADGSGNSDTCSTNVTVIDAVAPMLTCPDDTSFALSPGSCDGPFSYISPVSADACSGVAVTLLSGVGSGNVFQAGISIETYSSTDATGNVSTCSFEVTVLSAPMRIDLQTFDFVGGYEVSCFGNTDGRINGLVQGGCPPYTFAWSNGASSNQVADLAAGNYGLTVSDASSQTNSATVELEEPDELQVSAVVVDASGPGLADGTIDLTVLGGTDPYTFNWSNGTSAEDLSGLAAAAYEVTVTDQNGCSFADSYVISDCEVPTGMRVNAITESSAKLKWDCDPNAYAYEIRGNRVGVSGFVQLVLPPGCQPFFGANQLSPNSAYFWQVRKICDSAATSLSEWSEPDTFITRCLKPEPIAVNNIAANRARLDWTEVPGAFAYEIEGSRLGDPGVIRLQVPAPADQFLASGLSPSTSYRWKVRAICDSTVTRFSLFCGPDTFTTASPKALHSPSKDETIMMLVPNPAESEFKIALAGISGGEQLKIFSSEGVLVQSIEIDRKENQATLSVDASAWAKGVYVVQLASGDRIRSQRLIIQ